MMGMFVAADRVGDGGKTPYQPWFNSMEGVAGQACSPIPDNSSFCGKVFAEEQSTLDAIATDSRTDFAIPLVTVETQGIQWESADDVPGVIFGKVVAWIAAHGLHRLDPDMKSPAKIARHVLTQLSGDNYADALESFRIYWSE